MPSTTIRYVFINRCGVNWANTSQVLTLHVLESKGWTNKFFSMWFSSIDSFSRVHDKRLSIAAIVALLTLDVGQVPVSVQQGWPRLLQVRDSKLFSILTLY